MLSALDGDDVFASFVMRIFNRIEFSVMVVELSTHLEWSKGVLYKCFEIMSPKPYTTTASASVTFISFWI